MKYSLEPFGIYIHIPFCNSKCRYCDFFSIANFNEETTYLYGKKILETVSRALSLNKGKLVSLYLGGGTPSVMPDKWFAELIKIVSDHSENFKNIEITVEMNPAYITKERLLFFNSIGINRFSIGLQSLNDPLLLNIGRTYPGNKALDIISAARNITDNLSLDMIYGFKYPDRKIKEEFKDILNVVLPDHFSVYAYTPPHRANAPEPANESFLVAEENDVIDLLKKHDFDRYEVSNYARNGKESIHNNLYWTWKTYIGIGAGAHSFFKNGLERAYYENDIPAFIKNPALLRRKLSKDDALKEFFMMGLRRKSGISFEYFKENFDTDLNKIIKTDEIDSLINNGMLLCEKNNISVTESGVNYLSDITYSFFNAVEKEL